MVRASIAFSTAVAMRFSLPIRSSSIACCRRRWLGRIGSAIGHDVPDLVQAEPELAVEEDALQPIQIRVVVPAIAGLGPAAGAQQPDLVVVVQRPHGDPGEPGNRAYRQAHWFVLRHEPRA